MSTDLLAIEKRHAEAGGGKRAANQQFLAHSWQDIRDLLAEVKEQAARISTLEAQLAKLPPRCGVPRAQAFECDPRLGHSHWVDVVHDFKTREELVAFVRGQVESGEYVGYRLMHIDEESMGVTWAATGAVLVEGET